MSQSRWSKGNKSWSRICWNGWLVVATRFWMIWILPRSNYSSSKYDAIWWIWTYGLKITPTLWGLDWSPSQNHFPRLGWWLKINKNLNIPTSHGNIGNFKLSPLWIKLRSSSEVRWVSSSSTNSFQENKPSKENTLQEINISPVMVGIFESMIFRTSPGGICSFPGGSRQ